MAKQTGRLKRFRESVIGQILEAVIYAGLLILVCFYFTGNGTFIYEGF